MVAGEAGATGTSRALVLNATFEPLGLVSTRRALLLVLATKAELVHATQSDVPFRAQFPSPSRRWCAWPASSGSRTTGTVAVNRRTVFARDGHRCQYCGSPPRASTT